VEDKEKKFYEEVARRGGKHPFVFGVLSLLLGSIAVSISVWITSLFFKAAVNASYNSEPSVVIHVLVFATAAVLFCAITAVLVRLIKKVFGTDMW
jgi:hypothetical protein